MTIAVACNLSDGVVLGVDSAITVEGSIQTPRGIETGVLKVYNDAEKLFPLPNVPVGIMTYGLGTLNSRSIGSYIKEFEVLPDHQDKFAKWTLEELAEQLKTFFSEKYRAMLEERSQQVQQLPLDERNQIAPHQPSPLGLVVAGYSPKEYLAEVWHLSIMGDPSRDICEQRRPRGTFGCDWFGQANPITRFYKGFDPDILQNILNTFLPTNGVTPGQNFGATLSEILRMHEYVIPFDAMPIQEGIDLVKFLLGIAINQARFVIGAPICGGPIRIGVVSSAKPLELVTVTPLSVRAF